MALSKIFVAPKNGQGGVKKSKKKIFFQKKYSKDGKKKILGPLGPYLPKIDFGGQGGGEAPPRKQNTSVVYLLARMGPGTVRGSRSSPGQRVEQVMHNCSAQLVYKSESKLNDVVSA